MSDERKTISRASIRKQFLEGKIPEEFKGDLGGFWEKELINFNGVDVPAIYIFRRMLNDWDEFNDVNKFGPVKPLTAEEIVPIDDILKESNSEVRRAMIVLHGLTEFCEGLVRRGMGEVILEPVDENDYQYGRLWGIKYEVGANNTVSKKLLELVNRTIEPGAEKMSAKERKQAGLTPDGYKIYFLEVDNRIYYNTIQEAWNWTFGNSPAIIKEFEELTGTTYDSTIERKLLEA